MSARRPLALAAALVAVVAVLAGCGSHGSDAMASIVPGRDGDVAFAQLMIPHHQQAIEMADIALAAQAQPSADVRRLAEQIKAAQDPEIAQMTTWLQGWGAELPDPNVDHSGHSGMAGMMSAEDMDALRAASGTEFDRMWLEMMIEHHEGALTMAQQVIGTTDDASVTTLAKAVVAGQTAEIAEMKGLLAKQS